MITIKTRFDGEKVVIPPETLKELTPGEAIVIMGEPTDAAAKDEDWFKAQEEAVAKVWDNDADAE